MDTVAIVPRWPDDGAAGREGVRSGGPGRDGDRQPHAGLVLRPGRLPRRRGRDGRGGPGGRGGRRDRRPRRGQGRSRRAGRRGRGDRAGRRASWRRSGGATPTWSSASTPGGRRSAGPSARPAPTCSTTRGRARTPALAAVAAEHGAGLVCSHAGGLPPRTDPHRVAYDDVVADVVATVTGLAERAVAAGVRRDGILVDPAHDFGKNTYHSLEVTRRLDEVVATGWPVLVAVSRKKFLGEVLDAEAGDRLEATLAATAVAAWLGGAVLPGARRAGHPPGAATPSASIRGTRPPARGPPRPGLRASGLGLDAARPAAAVSVRGLRPGLEGVEGGRHVAHPGHGRSRPEGVRSPARPAGPPARATGRRRRPGRARRPACRASPGSATPRSPAAPRACRARRAG